MEDDFSREIDPEKQRGLVERTKRLLDEAGLLFNDLNNVGFVIPFGNEKEPIFVFLLVADTFAVFLSSGTARFDQLRNADLFHRLNAWNTTRALGSYELHKDGMVNYRYGCDEPAQLDVARLKRIVFHCATCAEVKAQELKELANRLEFEASSFADHESAGSHI